MITTVAIIAVIFARHSDDMSFSKARLLCQERSNNKWMPAAKEFLECDAEAQRQLLTKTFGGIPPIEVLERWSGVLSAKLHPTNLMWQYEDPGRYVVAVDSCADWFSVKHSNGTRRCRGIVKEGAEEDMEQYGSGIVTERVQEHFRRLKTPLRLRGMQNWKTINDICQEASVQIGSGSTETEAMNAELTHLLFAHPVTQYRKIGGKCACSAHF